MLRVLRRLFVAAGLAGVVASVVRHRSAGEAAPSGTWRELAGPDLR